MGKLADAIKAYKTSPINSPAEREAAEIIRSITDGQWWKDNVGKEFTWPKKFKYKRFGFEPDEFIHIGNFIIPIDQIEEYKSLLTKNNPLW
jgi:hypothetical protein